MIVVLVMVVAVIVAFLRLTAVREHLASGLRLRRRRPRQREGDAAVDGPLDRRRSVTGARHPRNARLPGAAAQTATERRADERHQHQNARGVVPRLDLGCRGPLVRAPPSGEPLDGHGAAEAGRDRALNVRTGASLRLIAANEEHENRLVGRGTGHRRGPLRRRPGRLRWEQSAQSVQLVVRRAELAQHLEKVHRIDTRDVAAYRPVEQAARDGGCVVGEAGAPQHVQAHEVERVGAECRPQDVVGRESRRPSTIEVGVCRLSDEPLQVVDQVLTIGRTYTR